MKLLFIGAGNMGQAIIGGIINKNVFSPQNIYIYEINEQLKKNVIGSLGINSHEIIDRSISVYDVIVLAVKPQVFLQFSNDETMRKLKEFCSKEQLIVSIMAGIPIQKLEDFFDNKCPVVRIMPNTPALVGESMSVISPSSTVTKDQLDIVKKLFNSVGKTEIMEEKYIDAVTGLSGSGPAYVFTFIEALTEGGIACGLNKDVAEKLAIQTVIGSALMLNKNNSPEELRKKVTSPGGTTIEGLSVLEKRDFKKAVIEAIQAATNRSIELSSGK